VSGTQAAWHGIRYSDRFDELADWRYGWRWRQALERVNELRFGAETSHDVSHAELGLEGGERIWYVPSEWTALRRALRSLDVGRDDVFVDFGSGKGRAVLAAARLPFKRVVGVEVSEVLTEVAGRNVERSAHRLRCRDVDLVRADALEFQIPDDVTVAYFFCPFTGSVFRAVIERLIASYDRSPRRLRVVYNYPYEHGYLVGTGRVRVVDVRPDRWPPRSLRGPDVIVTYEVVARGEPAPSTEAALASSWGLRRAPAWLGPHRPAFRLGNRVLRAGTPLCEDTQTAREGFR
jgi:SAM-dependent methyltransferase